MAVPIKGSNDAIIGVLAAADRETREGGIGAFEANELRLLSLFGNQVAIALENARLHRDALEKQALERDLELAATIQSNIRRPSCRSTASRSPHSRVRRARWAATTTPSSCARE